MLSKKIKNIYTHNVCVCVRDRESKVKQKKNICLQFQSEGLK